MKHVRFTGFPSPFLAFCFVDGQTAATASMLTVRIRGRRRDGVRMPGKTKWYINPSAPLDSHGQMQQLALLVEGTAAATDERGLLLYADDAPEEQPLDTRRSPDELRLTARPAVWVSSAAAAAAAAEAAAAAAAAPAGARAALANHRRRPTSFDPAWSYATGGGAAAAAVVSPSGSSSSSAWSTPPPSPSSSFADEGTGSSRRRTGQPPGHGAAVAASSFEPSQDGKLAPFCGQCARQTAGVSRCCGCGGRFGGGGGGSSSGGSPRSTCVADTAADSPLRLRDVPRLGSRARARCDACPPGVTCAVVGRGTSGGSVTCGECGDAVFCSAARAALWHRAPRRRHHDYEAGLRADERAAAAARRRRPPADAFPASTWAEDVEVSRGGDGCEVCRRADRDVVVIAEQTGVRACFGCAAASFHPRWGQLRVVLLRCGVCGEHEGRPALFECRRCRVAMCPQCWAVQHAGSQLGASSGAAAHAASNPYSAETSRILHGVGFFAPFVHYVVEGRRRRVEDAFPPRVGGGLSAAVADTSPEFLSFVRMAGLGCTPNCVKEDEWTRSYDQFPLVCLACGTQQEGEGKQQKGWKSQKEKSKTFFLKINNVPKNAQELAVGSTTTPSVMLRDRSRSRRAGTASSPAPTPPSGAPYARSDFDRLMRAARPSQRRTVYDGRGYLPTSVAAHDALRGAYEGYGVNGVAEPPR